CPVINPTALHSAESTLLHPQPDRTGGNKKEKQASMNAFCSNTCDHSAFLLSAGQTSLHRHRPSTRHRTTVMTSQSSGRKTTTTTTRAVYREVETLQKGIAELYDESSGIWEDIWGDHMHHGFYDPNATVSVSDHRSAQIRMIEEALRFASVPGTTFTLSRLSRLL
ncbi:unnamed protein product, partial [Ilex paraguariensis]